jgi:hypothetical protein
MMSRQHKSDGLGMELGGELRWCTPLDQSAVKNAYTQQLSSLDAFSACDMMTAVNTTIHHTSCWKSSFGYPHCHYQKSGHFWRLLFSVISFSFAILFSVSRAHGYGFDRASQAMVAPKEWARLGSGNRQTAFQKSLGFPNFTRFGVFGETGIMLLNNTLLHPRFSSVLQYSKW